MSLRTIVGLRFRNTSFLIETCYLLAVTIQALFGKVLRDVKTFKALDTSISPSEWYQYFAGLLYDENAVVIDQPSDHYIDPSASVLNEPCNYSR